MKNTTDLLLHGWEVHPTVILGCVALIGWYFREAPHKTKYSAPFVLGVFILCLALISPIDPLGDAYLFSAHMLQHLLLILIVPPLLILGLRLERVAGWMSHPAVGHAASILGRPVVAWSCNMLMMIIWHLPVLYNAANANTSIHILEHLTFLVTGCMFWWPIAAPLESQRIQAGPAMLYLFGAAAISTLLGIVITFLPVGLYTPYLHPVDELGALQLIRQTWGISAAEDQKLAGLLMWVPGCSVYFAVILLKLATWFQTPGADKRALLANLNDSPGEMRHG